MLKHKCLRSPQDGRTYSSDTTVMDTQECPKAEPTAEIILMLRMLQSITKRCIPKAKPQGNDI